MEKGSNPPPYGWSNTSNLQPPPAAPPSYSQAVGGVGPSSPYTPHYAPTIVVTEQRSAIVEDAAAFAAAGVAALSAAGTAALAAMNTTTGAAASPAPPAPRGSACAGPQIVTTVVPVGPHPTHMICPSCHSEIDTATQTKPGLIAYISGAIIFLLGCFCGCCLIPCCIDSCMDVHHKCPHCNAYLGRFRR